MLHLAIKFKENLKIIPSCVILAPLNFNVIPKTKLTPIMLLFDTVICHLVTFFIFFLTWNKQLSETHLPEFSR